MKLSYSKKILALALLVFLVVLILNVIFTNLLLGKIADINNKVKQMDISSQERERELNLKDSIVSTKTDREELAGYFVGASDAQTVEFTKTLESLAKNQGVTYSIKSLDYEPVNGLATSNTIISIRFKFNVAGKWSNVFSFLQAIENLPNIVLMNSVSFNLNSELSRAKSAGSNWSADMDFSVAKLKI